MDSAKYIFLVFLVAGCVLVAQGIESKRRDKPVTGVSHSINTLGNIIHLNTYKPNAVSFTYHPIDYSVQRGVVSFESDDYYLEALLYFDEATFDTIKKTLKDKKARYSRAYAHEFAFDWLPQNIKDQLLDRKHLQTYDYMLFQSGGLERFLLIDHAILLIIRHNG